MRSQKRSENAEYRPLCSGPAHWIPACAGMTGYGPYRGSTRPKASFQTASQGVGSAGFSNSFTKRLYTVLSASAGVAVPAKTI